GVALAAVVERGHGDDGGARATWGALPEGELEVRENGVRFGVDLAHGQKGGLFLDQRDNRALVRTLARGRRVLNLFGYTGGFSVFAAAGGARATVTVDVAAPAIAAARPHLERHRPGNRGQRLVPRRPVALLEPAGRGGERSDVVTPAPPSFAPNRRALAAGLRAYRRLHRLCASVTAPGGTLCAASCSSHVDRKTFLATVRDGASDAGRRFQLQELRGAAADHPVIRHFPEGDYLKFAVGTV